MMKISICIPTYNRPDLLEEALESCFNQTLQPFEILIGDDSTNNETSSLIKKLQDNNQFNIQYFYNNPSLGQTGNINKLFNTIKGDKVVLLHDDDLLLPQALEKLAFCFKKDPEVKVVFGKQYIIDANGSTDLKASENLNNVYFRTKSFQGNFLTSLEAGFLQQFPNDGYMLDASVLKEVNYRKKNGNVGELGYGSEYDFGLQVGIRGFKMYFTDEFICKYRKSRENSISSSSTDDAGLKAFMLLRSTDVPDASYKLKVHFLKKKVPIAISQACKTGKRAQAMALFFSKWHRSKILSPGGAKRLIMIFFPKLFLN